MTQRIEPHNVPPTQTSSVDKQVAKQPAPNSPNDTEQLNLQGSNVHMPSIMTTQLSSEPAASIDTPAHVIKKGTREFATGVSIQVEALTLAG